MLTKKIKTRLFFLLSVIFITLLFLAFIYFSLKQNILYFKTPSEIFIVDGIKSNSKIRVGGMVKKDSIQQNNKEIKLNKKIKAEKLYRKDKIYDIVIVINYNTRRIIKNKGSAIFIHVTNNYKPTRGCIALSLNDLEILLKIIKRNSKIKIS